MDRVSALEHLGLGADASDDEIDAAFVARMRKVHPDSGTAPDEDAAKILNDARRATIRTTSSALVVPQRVGLTSSSARPSEPTHAAESASVATVNTLVTHHAGQLGFRKRERIVLASGALVIAAGMSVVAGLMKVGNDQDYETRRWLLMLAVTLTLISAATGVLSWIAGLRETFLRLELEDAAETLSDRSTYRELLRELPLAPFWTRSDLILAVGRWVDDWQDLPRYARRERPSMARPWIRFAAVPLAATASRIGRVDFARLVLVKGLEIGLIEEASVGQDEFMDYGFRAVTPRVAGSGSA